ncbi:hypothetical protein [Paenibacillus macquariensis]|uniref:Uncharacterized protein n=1 Tax=Paenibacillus macquariensis TaxID=948756 RepID=A0ABY1JWX3_9BACL|nr:hypothetical protein [Paenibacillus macquariensis]MEC0089408.1 hypothetical protein [Paenibacillus macquariensis]OAB33205.1 hypothetical protein PMSM_14400 [Paenibacillus macquariensis subsp. macquariensis]SIQ91884.1 hypothetical protein SAMN05421578_10549 [Paenibacillus macquariensis]
MNSKLHTEDLGYLFKVDILIKNESNARALQSLIEMMNGNKQVMDFRIQSGIELGEIIDSLLQSKEKNSLSKIESNSQHLSKTTLGGKTGKEIVQSRLKNSLTQEPISTPTTKNPASNHSEDPRVWIKSCINDNRLVRLTANRKGKHMEIPCRILNFDEEQQFVNVYHVDEKQVYSFMLNEIDAFTD